MSILTPFFNLFKLAKTDDYDIQQFNDNMDIIDEEMHRPPLTVNEIEPDPETRNIPITTVPLADNLTSEEAQVNEGTYIERTSGGEASIADGSAWLSDIKGNMVKTGYVAEVLNWEFYSDDAEATLDEDVFRSYVQASGTITLTYDGSAWSADPELYGFTITGTPADGDSIVIQYVKENRGTITVADPTSFVSTGWNLYNNAVGYAKVVKYSTEYGFMIAGTYTSLKFAETLDGEQTTITPVAGFFTVPADGFVFVTGGNSTDTAIWMTWSDWTEEANGGVFEAYTSNVIDLTGVMANFPDGLMRVGNIFDEINLNVKRAYSRIEKLAYTPQNLENVISSGVQYDTDTNFIYAERVAPAVYTITLDGQYEVSDHGLEYFVGTTVPVTASSLYGNDLKGKLRRDVLTISAQELTPAQQAQVQENIGIEIPSFNIPYMSETLTGNGLTCYLHRWGRVVTFTMPGKAPTNAINANATIFTFPEAYRPISGITLIGDNGGWSAYSTFSVSSTTGALTCKAAISGAIAVHGCYLANDLEGD